MSVLGGNIVLETEKNKTYGIMAQRDIGIDYPFLCLEELAPIS